MALSAGTTIGSYEVTAQIGAGGMGEVYRATDTKLNRDVALKVLPEAFTSSPERLARFEREAKVLASLNHPNIGHIYGLEEAEGTKALVLELVEGPTLTERVARGPIPIEDALNIARQIAEALETAHEQGIIHRDLKPANVKVRDDGTVKVLDFGLAKVFQAESDGAESDSPTLTAAATRPGVILETAAYMSPEQAKGEPVDKRSDIWAFGCVLYEMLTGRRTFEGESVSEIMAGVIKGEPDWDALPNSLSTTLVALLRRSLQKDPKERFRDIGDVRLLMVGTFDIGLPSTPELRVWQRTIPAIVAGLVLLALGWIAAWALMVDRTTEPSPTTTRLTITLPDFHQLPHRSAGRAGVPGANRVAVSLDGQTVVYNPFGDLRDQLFQRPINQFEGVPIMHTESAGTFFFSPDGQWVGFWAGGALWKVALVGGPSQELTKLPGGQPRGASWGSNGMIVIGNPRGLVQVPEAGGEPVIIAEQEGEGALSHPQVLSGIGAILYTVSEPSPHAGELQVLLPETGERRTVLHNAVAGRVLDTGHLVFARSGGLWAVPFDRKRLEIAGNPVPVLEEVSVGRGAFYAVADNGTLVYVPHFAAPAIEKALVLVDRQGTVDPVPLPPDSYDYPRFSPDGTRIAVQINTRGGDSDIFIYDLSSNRLEQLTFNGAEVPLWTPDGTQITFLANDALWNIASDFSSEPKLLSAASEKLRIAGPYSWSPDGRVLFWEGGGDVAQLTRLEGGGVEHGLLLNERYVEVGANFSADGEWFSFATNQTGAFEVYVQPYSLGTGAKRRITQRGGTIPIWSRSGRDLFYSNDGQLWAVEIETKPTLNWQDPVALFDTPWPLSTVGFANYDVSPDGQRFVFVQPMGAKSEDQPHEIRVVLNWFEELKAKVPIP